MVFTGQVSPASLGSTRNVYAPGLAVGVAAKGPFTAPDLGNGLAGTEGCATGVVVTFAGAGSKLGDADGALLGVIGISGDTSDNDEAAALAGIAAAGLVADTGA